MSPVPVAESDDGETSPENAGHPWAMWGGSIPVVVSGGSVSVNTADLDALSSSLTSAAGSLDDARSWIDSAISDVRMAPLPAGQKIYGSYDLQPHQKEPWYDDGMQCVAGERLPRSMYSDQPYETDESGAVHFNALSYFDAVAFDQERNAAISALNELSSGPGSLVDVADTLRGLASDVTACSQAHTLAEGGAAPGPDLVGPVDIRAFDGGLAYQALGISLSAMSPNAVSLAALAMTPGSPLYPLLEQYEGGQAVVEALQLLLADPATAQWVKEDAVRIALLTLWLTKARTGRESATIQAYLKQVSERLDPWVTQRLPAQVAAGTQTVDTTTLTPMQRVTMYLGMNATALGAGVYGRQTGITVTPVGGSGSTVLPPATKDPLGLGSPVQAGMTGRGKESRSPQSISETIAHCQEVQSSKSSLEQADDEDGVISIQRVEHADGRVSWVVYVPGTTDWTVGDGEPQDLLTNLEGVGGTPTVMESAVVTAMRQAGIQSGDEVALYGHSQGGITVSNIAADPAIQDRYNITTVLTAGAPTAGADIPDDVHALHVENTGDAVPGLDAAPTPTGPHRQVAMVDTHQMSTGDYPHASSVYAQATEGIEDRAPELTDWSTSFSRASGAGEQGTATTEYTFTVQRNTDSSGVYKDGDGYQGEVPSSAPSYELPTPAPQPSGEH
ncbi:hypothetical protein [Actinomyces viscosus]|uniref:Alpha/beta hydrolase family n=1 Tax=Actinomyces viscosus TaxID=1656 RepID=A0A448PMZ4_ACTVI|nr:hypothetical protein [Actinomyces viscosus]VEI17337.1 Uncharacterised protein [Actinomyces viscosus]